MQQNDIDGADNIFFFLFVNFSGRNLAKEQMAVEFLKNPKAILFLQNSWSRHRDLTETIESGPLCITDLFQNKSVAYFFNFFKLFQKKKNIYIKAILCNFSMRTKVFPGSRNLAPDSCVVI